MRSPQPSHCRPLQASHPDLQLPPLQQEGSESPKGLRNLEDVAPLVSRDWDSKTVLLARYWGNSSPDRRSWLRHSLSLRTQP